MKLNRLLGAWPVSNLAIKLAIKAFNDHAWQVKAHQQQCAMRQAMLSLFGEFKFEKISHTDLFISVKHKEAQAIWLQLAQKGIACRNFPKASQNSNVTNAKIDYWHDPELLRFGLCPSLSSLDRLKSNLRACNYL